MIVISFRKELTFTVDETYAVPTPMCNEMHTEKSRWTRATTVCEAYCS